MSSSARAVRRWRLLLVENYAPIRHALSKLLAADADVVAVADAAGALACCTEQQFDLIVADYHLPDMSGAELLCRLRLLDPAPRRVMTSGSLVPDLSWLVRNGLVHDFLLKPVSLEAFLRLLNSDSHPQRSTS